MKQKQTIKLNETQLRGLIKESIKTILKESDFNSGDGITPEEVIEPLKRNVSRNYEFYNVVFNAIKGLQEVLGLSKEKILQYVNALANHRDLDYMVNQIALMRYALEDNDTEKLKAVFQQVFEPRVLNEDEFTPHGYSADCNYGGKEIQLSDDGEMARLRTNYGDGPSKPTRWLKIYFNNDGVAYVMFKGRRLRLDQFMRY